MTSEALEDALCEAACVARDHVDQAREAAERAGANAKTLAALDSCSVTLMGIAALARYRAEAHERQDRVTATLAALDYGTRIDR